MQDISLLINMVKGFPEGAFISSSSGEVVHLNEKMCNLLGCTSNELLGSNIQDAIDDLDFTVNDYPSMLSGTKGFISYEGQICFKKGKRIYGAINSSSHLIDTEVFLLTCITENSINDQTLNNQLSKFDTLTRREQEVFKLLLGDTLYKDIAEQLEISINTVKFHVSNLYSKMGIRSINDLKKEKTSLRFHINSRNIENVFDSISDAITVHDENHNVLFANNAAKKLFKYNGEKTKCYQIFHGTESPPDYCKTPHNLKTREPSKVEYYEPFIEKYLEVDIFPIFDRQDEMTAFVRHTRDITERKASELALCESEENYRLLVENQSDLVVKVDKEGRFLFVSESYCRMLDKTQDELLGNLFMPLVHEDDLEPTLEVMKKLYEPPHAVYIEQRAMTINGWRWLAWSDTAIVDDKGEVLSIIGVGRDITDKKRAEELLYAEKQMAQKYLNVAGVMFVALDDKGIVSMINPKGCEILGYQHDEIIGKNWFENFLPQKQRAPVAKVYEQLMSGKIKPVQYYENVVLAKDNRERTIAFHNTILNNSEGHITGTLASGSDITEQKEAKMALAQSEEKYRHLVEHQTDLVVKVDTQCRLLFVSESYCRLYDKTQDELLGNTFLPFVHEEDREQVQRELKALIKPPHKANIKHKALTTEGVRWQSWATNAIFDDNGAMSIIAVGRDITQRMQAEEALKQSHERMFRILNSIDAAVYVADMDTYEVLFANQYIKGLLGDIEGKICWQAIQEGQNGPCDFCTNKYLLNEDGNPKEPYRWEYNNPIHGLWHDISDRAIQWIDGRIVRLEIAIDITERKQTEEALIESENKFRTLIANAPLGVLISQEGIVKFANDAIAKICGYDSPEEIQGISIVDLIAPESREFVLQKNLLREHGGIVSPITGALGLKKNGGIYPYESSSVLIKINKEPVTISFLADITERKQAEEILQKSEERFRELFNNTPNAYQSLDEDGRFVDVNNDWLDMLGYTEQEIMGRSFEEFWSDETKGMFPHTFDHFKKVCAINNSELVLKKNDGELITVLLTGRVQTDKDGKFLKTHCIITDITERKKAEELIENFFSLSRDMLCIANSTHFIKVSPSFTKTLGYTEEELLKISHLDMLHPDDIQSTTNLIDEKLDSGEGIESYINRFRHKDGSYRYFEWMASNDDRNIVYAIARDITQRRKIDESLKQTLNEKEMLIKEVHHRVKNNLAVIQSLLSLQVKDIKDEKSREYFADAENRVQSMGMIHTMLHDSEDLTKLKSKDYIPMLAKTLFSNYKIDAHAIRLKTDIQDIALDVDTIIPLGLIINELVSNALKYAFIDNRKGELIISLKENDDESYELIIKDTGVGLPENFNLMTAKSLGLLIVNSLVRQINGTLNASNRDGAEFRITFTEEAL
jgi:PAS domain S-box-containing protein